MPKAMKCYTCLFMFLLAYVMPVQAQHMPFIDTAIRAESSGFWINNDQAAHGVQLEVLAGNRALLSWYTYQRDGTPLWLIGEGVIDGQTVKADLLQFSDGRPPAYWHESSADSTIWGSAMFTFEDCDRAVLSWDSANPDFAEGQLEFTRYTTLQGMRCQAEEQFNQQITFSFERNKAGFSAVFADLPADYDAEIYELDFRHEQLPAPLSNRGGLRLTGHNRSDDLAMLVKKPIRGLEPSAYYYVELDAEIASNVPTGCSGIGGSPGESVYVKLGASPAEPLVQADVDNWLRLTIDNGNQSISGVNGRVAGTIGNSHSCDESVDAPWELLSFSNRIDSMYMSTDEEGTLWIFAGTDSGFEGLTQFYLTRLHVRLAPLAEQ